MTAACANSLLQVHAPHHEPRAAWAFVKKNRDFDSNDH
jgi:hypothetical protein